LYPNSTFPWIQKVEAHYTEILQELNSLLSEKNIPEFRNLSPEQKRIVKPLKWKTFILFVYGNKVKENCEQCPKTMKALQNIPGIQTAMFSVFEPGTHLKPHRGPFNGVLRYHLALIVPKEVQQCSIMISGESYYWRVGKSMVFDDTFEHEAWNYSCEKRVVLFVDFLRPSPRWLQPLNRFMVWLIGSSPFVKNVLVNIRGNEG
jgi:beta-hydroxylase